MTIQRMAVVSLAGPMLTCALATSATAQGPAPVPRDSFVVEVLPQRRHGDLLPARIQPRDRRLRPVGTHTETDATGHARLARPAPGSRLRLSVHRLGFVADTIDLAAGAVPDTLRLTLAPSVMDLCMVQTMDVRFAVWVQLAGPVVQDTVAVHVRVRDGAFTDSATVVDSLRRQEAIRFAGERPGRYRITVTARGYRPWEVRDVRVQRSPSTCRVDPHTVTATLVPQSPRR